MRIFGELQTVDEDQPALGYSLCATAILSMADVTETSFFPQREQDARLSPQLMRKIGIFGARYSHRPTGDGLIAVMRLIPDDGDKVPTFKQTGLYTGANPVAERHAAPPGRENSSVWSNRFR